MCVRSQDERSATQRKPQKPEFNMDRLNASPLKPGDSHYAAYVGPPDQYDFMGATQFRLLCALGLRARHTLLDFGCGSLRAGKFFLSYLDQRKYFGIDPNPWLIEAAISKEIGKDLIALKKPEFDYNTDFKTDVFSKSFDFILAQSIFSHADGEQIETALRNFHNSMKPDGLIAATFIEAKTDFRGKGWTYPECVQYRPATLRTFIQNAGLSFQRIPWHHPRQTWYLLARSRDRLPDKVMLKHLTGAVLFDSSIDDRFQKPKRNLLLKPFTNWLR